MEVALLLLPKPQSRANQIRALIYEERLDQAEFVLRRFTSELPTAEVHYLRGMILAVRKRYSEARQQLEQAVALTNRQEPTYLYNYARQFYALQEYPQAEAIFEEVLRLEPGYFNAYDALARIYVDSRGYEQAMTVVAEAIALAEQGKLDTATIVIGTPVQASTPYRQLALLHFLRASFLAGLDKPEEAVEAVRRSLSYFHEESQAAPLATLTVDFLKTVSGGIPRWFVSFVASAAQAEQAGGDWQDALPLFTVEQWAEALPDERREECLASIYAAMQQAQRDGNWLPAVRLAENWQETTWLMANPEFQARVGPLLRGEITLSPEHLVSEEEFFERMRESS